MFKMRDLAVLGCLGLALLPGSNAHAIKDRENQGRWTKPTVNNLPDKEVPGFLVNLGPSGARAVLTDKTFIIKYIFKGSPAEGRLRLEDTVTGAFGKAFSAHSFGGGHGYEGPIMDLGLAIDKAEGKDGKLVLNVSRGTETLEVKIDLEALGAFSATFPMQCRKSELLRAKALKYFADHPDSWTVWQAHARSAVTLALLSSEDPKQHGIGKDMVLKWSREAPDAGTWSWGLAYQLITLGEYHLLTRDPAVLPMIRIVVNFLEKAQYSGRILVWGPTGDKALEKLEYAKVDAAQQLYDGGFGHGPYKPGASPPTGGFGVNGYGPMQYTTILPVIAWQLALRCGVEVNPDSLKRALAFIHRGTNAAGYVAYGGEFTLNAGLQDPVAFKKSTGGDNYVGRSGAAFIAHKLSPEDPEAPEYMGKYKGFLKHALKSLPDGHADSNLGIFWGLLGAGASEDEGVLRAMLDYHKAWFNMMRCHDGSFVLLPGRDYADEGYYMASRYHPTATMALVLGLNFPKLQIQGLQVSIPGINPKLLTGTTLAAYKAITAKSYGEAARMLKAAGPEAAPMLVYLEGQARRALDGLGLFERTGRWTQIQQRLAELRRSHGGIPAFDEAAAAWETRFKARPGTALLAADKLCADGFHGKALAALQPALDTNEKPASQLIHDRILGAARATLAAWDGMEKAGEWHKLRKEVDLHRERFRGVAIVDERTAALESVLTSETGRLLVEADRLLAEGSSGPALKVLASADSEPARLLKSRATAAMEGVLRALEALDKEGRWHSLKEAISKARPKMAGIQVFEDQTRAWEASFATPAGRALINSEKLFAQGDLGGAAKALASAEDRSAEPQKRIEAAVKAPLATLADLQAKGDWFAVERALPALRKKLSGVPAFDARDTELLAALKTDPAKSAARQGAALARLREAAAGRTTPALLRELEAFVQQAGDSLYGREAKELLKSLR